MAVKTWKESEDRFLIAARETDPPMTFAEIGKFLGRSCSSTKARMERLNARPEKYGYEPIDLPSSCPSEFIPRLLKYHPEGYQDGPIGRARLVNYSRQPSLPVFRSTIA